MSDGHVHTEAHTLVATPAQVLLWEQQGTEPGLMTAVEPAAAQPHGQGQLPWDLCQWPLQPSALASGLQCTLVLACPSLSLGDAEESSPSLSGLLKSTASSHGLLPLPAQTPTLTFANRSLERKWNARAVVCSQPALQSSRLCRRLVRSLPTREHCRSCAAVGKPQPVLGQVHFLESHREATMLFPEQLKHILSPGAAGSSSHPRTAEQDAGLAHLSLQHHRLRTAPAREIRAVTSENQGGLLCTGQPHFSPPKMTSTSSCPAARLAQAGGEGEGKACWHPPQSNTGWKCWQHKAKGRAAFCT